MIHFKQETQKGECLKPIKFALLVKFKIHYDFGDGSRGALRRICLHISSNIWFIHETLTLVVIKMPFSLLFMNMWIHEMI